MFHTALDVFKHRQSQSLPTVLIFYRGERSFFCRQWLKRWLSIPGMHRRLDLADIFLLFISSQSQGKAYSVADQIAGNTTVLDSRVFFYGDPEHLLVNYLIELGISRPMITYPDSHRVHGWVFDYGMVQPAVVAVGVDATVLYEWTAKRGLLSMARKLDRPDPWVVWDRIERRIDRIRIAKDRNSRKAMAALRQLPPPQQQHQQQRQGNEGGNSVLAPTSPASTVLTNQNSVQSLPATHLLTHEQQLNMKVSQPQIIIEMRRQQPQQKQMNEVNGGSGNNQFAPLSARSRQGTGSGTETPHAPLSLAIDTVTLSKSMISRQSAREETDISVDDVASADHVHHLSATINALANSSVSPHKSSHSVDVNDIPKLAEHVFRVQRQANVHSLVQVDAAEQCKEGEKLEHEGPLQYNVPDAQIENARLIIEDENGMSALIDAEIDDEENNEDEDEDGSSSDDESSESDYFASVDSEAVSIEDENDVDDQQLDSQPQKKHPDPLIPSVDAPPRALAQERLKLLENSVSLSLVGSDHVDSPAIITKHASVRTDDSALINMLSYEVLSVHSDPDIPEEADDKKTGISDYLKDLKDPVHRRGNRYRTRHDNLPPLPRGRFSNPSGRTRPVSTTEHSQPVKNKSTNSPALLTESLLRRETGRSLDTPPPDNLSRTTRNNNDRTMQPIVDDKQLKAAEGRSFNSTFDGAPGTSSPHPEANNPNKPYIAISPFADAENGLDDPGETQTRSSMRDEYEAYDEYIVCEYEVEECVEEYESDAFSDSEVFVDATVAAAPRSIPSALKSGGELEETAEPQQQPDQDENSAKLGRKETIKRMLRKLPMPKARKRSHTSEGLIELGRIEKTHLDDETECLGRRHGLQGVLQRLPSLSGSNRGQRVSLKLEGLASKKTIPGGELGTATMNNEKVDVKKERVTGRSMSQQGNLDWNVDTDSERGNGVGNVEGRRNKFRRNFSRLSPADLEEPRPDRVVRTNNEGAAQGERLKRKMSFALVRGRLMSRFRMS